MDGIESRRGSNGRSDRSGKARQAGGRGRICFLAALVVSAVGLAAGANRAEGASPAFLAEPDPAGGVKPLSLAGGQPVPVAGDLALAEWRPFGLRASAPEDPAGDGCVRGEEGDLPRVRVRADYSLIAYSAIGSDVSGIAAVGASGPQVLLTDAGDRYRPLAEGSVVAPGGWLIGVAVRGTPAPEVLIIDISGASPLVRSVSIPDPYDSLEPRSLAMTTYSLFFGVYGKDTLFDVFVAGDAGPARNVTSSPGRYLQHDLAAPRLAVSHDGKQVAYDLR